MNDKAASRNHAGQEGPMPSKKFAQRRTKMGEVVGGGYWVFRRGKSTNRIAPGSLPFEYDNAVDAHKNAARLACKHPGERFVVVVQTDDPHEVEV